MYDNMFDDEKTFTEPPVRQRPAPSPLPPVNMQPVPEKKPEKKAKKKGTGKRILTAILTGIIFGVCAGFALFVVLKQTGTLDALKNANNTPAVTTNPVDNGATDEADTMSEPSDSNSLPDISTDDADDGEITQTITDDTELEDTDTSDGIKAAMDVSDVVEMVMPAMVSIRNTFTYTSSSYWGTSSQTAVAAGTGFIVGVNDEELLIATNNHVVEGAEQLVVTFVDASEAEAKIKGTDPAMDLAVIAVDPDTLSASTKNSIATATLGDSDSLIVGQPAIAIGNALGYGQSVSVGVVSALNREVDMEDGSKGIFIQTDAAINPGNSGGALLDVNGYVIGINSNKIGGSAVEGMGYAIPISAAKPIISELMLQQTRSVVSDDQKGYLGISGITVTDDIASTYGMPNGVYVARVYDNTAAQIAGIAQGDVITSIDGKTVNSMDELETELGYYAQGDEITLGYQTPTNLGYVEKSVTVTLGSR